MSTPTITVPILTRVTTPVGVATLEPLRLGASSTSNPDIGTLHAWLDHPGAEYWGLHGCSAEQVRRFLTEWDEDPHRSLHLLSIDGLRVGLAVFYDPAAVELEDRIRHRAGDLGMHLLVAPTRTQVPGTTAAVMGAICRTAFEAAGARRLVVEPDVRNVSVHRLNARAGFRQDGLLDLPDKTALLSFCDAGEFEESEIGWATRLLECARPSWEPMADSSSSSISSPTPTPAHPAPHQHAHLTGYAMRRAHRHLCAKALSEFAHERLVTPVPDQGTYVTDTAATGTGTDRGYSIDAGDETWSFRARRLPLEHWVIDEGSVRRRVRGVDAEVDAQALIIALTPQLGIPADLTGIYLEEIAATLGSAAFCLHHHDRPARELVDADLQTVEAAMTEGHPGFVANNGRVGLGLDDRHRYTPEAPMTTRLVWLAARREVSHLATVDGLDEPELYRREFGADALSRCHEQLLGLGLDPDDYRLIPVHPWQWDHSIAVAFAPDLARRDLVYLGHSDDTYRPQQSVRTFFDLTHPERGYVKTALAVQNMGFTRGLSPRYMRDTPAVNDWVARIVDTDPVLRELGFDVLREVAAVGYTGDAYHRACDIGASQEGPHTKLIAALWRESPVPRLGSGERAFTLAALLHVDLHGQPFVVELISRSGLDARDWLRALLDVYLLPVARCLLTHGVVFMPHGENVILVVGSDRKPKHALFKDIGEEVAVVRDVPGRPLPPEISRLRHIVNAETAALSIHTDVLDGVLRHLAVILDSAGLLGVDEFWLQARESLLSLADRAVPDEMHRPTWDALFARTFRHSCLNRLQLRDARQMVDLADQAGSLQFAGELENPLAAGRSQLPGS